MCSTGGRNGMTVWVISGPGRWAFVVHRSERSPALGFLLKHIVRSWWRGNLSHSLNTTQQEKEDEIGDHKHNSFLPSFLYFFPSFPPSCPSFHPFFLPVLPPDDIAGPQPGPFLVSVMGASLQSLPLPLPPPPPPSHTTIQHSLSLSGKMCRSVYTLASWHLNNPTEKCGRNKESKELLLSSKRVISSKLSRKNTKTTVKGFSY